MSLAELQGAYAVLEHKHQNLQKRQKKTGNDKTGGKRHKGTKGNEPAQPITAASCKFYCHAHGHQNSHNSAQCKVMANQTGNFTAAMRKAPDPQQPPGGSTLVKGQTLTADPAQATAYMLVSVDHRDPDENGSSSSEDAFVPPNPDDFNSASETESPPRSPREDMQSSSVQQDISYDHHAAHLEAMPGLQPEPRLSFFDDEYVRGQRVAVPPPTAMDMDFESPRAVNHVRDSIAHMLTQDKWLPDFKDHRIPSIGRDPQAHNELHWLLLQRMSTERELTDMMEDRAADGTPLDPKRDFEDEYHTLNQRYDDLNRTMFKRYIQFLDAPRPPMERKRKADNALTAVDESPTTVARKMTIQPLFRSMKRLYKKQLRPFMKRHLKAVQCLGPRMNRCALTSVSRPCLPPLQRLLSSTLSH
jgi:hypothetical protein